MYTISLCMIVRDEEKVISRCLDSVKELVDEIIIVDTGSVDRTKEIASKYTNKIYDFEWVNDFSKARNFSFSKATGDYILWLDADDIILPNELEKFKKLKKTLDYNFDIYQMKYDCASNAYNTPTSVYIRSRLLKREKNYQWVSPIHEVIMPEGNIKQVDITITHKKLEVKDVRRNIKIFEEMKANGIELDERQEYCYAKEFFYLGEYERAVEEYEKYINKYEQEYVSMRYYLYPSFLELSECYKQLNMMDECLEILLKILKYEAPGEEFCSKIGEVFLERKNYKTAIFWFENAINISVDNLRRNQY